MALRPLGKIHYRMYPSIYFSDTSFLEFFTEALFLLASMHSLHKL